MIGPISGLTLTAGTPLVAAVQGQSLEGECAAFAVFVGEECADACPEALLAFFPGVAHGVGEVGRALRLGLFALVLLVFFMVISFGDWFLSRRTVPKGADA
ncbi:hypothetical protein X740_15755 [Mesorhizobium sp. LNHC221B00]|uniref:hypothetical protein n=1 Tax=Mesorhizobium sp. LNHC221B00 TaxID=1287233 RepID=UPI0003CE0C56|nr:hypothetical protein [Mesorhizobium sp. LNHC221B00]ESY79481.1 hypothetical protein X740_15755 [Mesorhizobium sp. LNHC221B00]